jgi:hypothetical protein
VRVGDGARVRRCVLTSGTRVAARGTVEARVVIPARRLRSRPRGSHLVDGHYSMELP